MNIKKIRKYLSKSPFLWLLRSFHIRYYNISRRKFGHIGKNVILIPPIGLSEPKNIFLYDNVNIYANSSIITAGGKFIMKKNSGSASGLTVVTGNHNPSVGYFFKDLSSERIGDIEKDIVVEEDVWIGANVTILSGVNVGRGAIVGAGSVCRNKIPPYSIVIGNPAKVVGFKFSPDEVIEHEKILYPENERLNYDLLTKNYEKYYTSKIAQIRTFIK